MTLLERFSEIVDGALGPVATVATPKTPDATDIRIQKQSGSVGSDGSDRKHSDETTTCTLPQLSADDHAAIREAIEERAAIREFDGGEPRAVAEHQAAAAMRIYKFRLADKPDTWLTMLAPGCELDQAHRDLVLRFGADRLLEVCSANPPTR